MTTKDADTYTIKGSKFYRMTRFLSAVGAADFSGIPAKDLDFYLQRGTERHLLWEHVERGIDGKFDYDARVEVFRASHAKFLKDTGFRALPGGIELQVHATWRDLGFPYDEVDGMAGLAGTLDRLGTIQNRVVLLDYKGLPIPPSTAAQTAGYLLMIPGYKFNEVERYGVGFGPNGKYQMSAKYPYDDKAEVLGLIAKFIKEKTNVAH